MLFPTENKTENIHVSFFKLLFNDYRLKSQIPFTTQTYCSNLNVKFERNDAFTQIYIDIMIISLL